VSVGLRSDPPGAQYYVGTAAVPGSESSYALPWGTNQVTAKYGLFSWARGRSQTLVVKKGAPNNYEFKFNYGTVILTNVPEEVKVKEGARNWRRHPAWCGWLTNGLGLIVTICIDGADKIEKSYDQRRGVLANGFDAERAGEIKNSIGMRLVKIHNLLGQGKDCWVGKYEVTQAEYQMVMGTNPSAPPVGVTIQSKT